ncbi:MAG: beta-lysylation protein EpmB, partial [Pseudomonadota bacterium]
MTQNWQTQLASAFSNFDELCHYLQLSPDELSLSQQARAQFPLRVPLAFASRMEKGNPADPLLRQVLPVLD